MPWRSRSDNGSHDARTRARPETALQIRRDEALRLLPRLRGQRVVHGTLHLDAAARRQTRHRARRIDRGLVLRRLGAQRRQPRRSPRAQRAHLRASRSARPRRRDHDLLDLHRPHARREQRTARRRSAHGAGQRHPGQVRRQVQGHGLGPPSALAADRRHRSRPA